MVWNSFGSRFTNLSFWRAIQKCVHRSSVFSGIGIYYARFEVWYLGHIGFLWFRVPKYTKYNNREEGELSCLLFKSVEMWFGNKIRPTQIVFFFLSFTLLSSIAFTPTIQMLIERSVPLRRVRCRSIILL